MMIRYGLGLLLLGATLAVGSVSVSPAAACDDTHCSIEPVAAPPEQPLTLRKFMHRPVASAAVRSVKTRRGDYAQVRSTHHRKHTAKARRKAESQKTASTDAAEQAAAPAPVVSVAAPVDNDAARAADSVQVVTADEINAIDLAAGEPTRTIAEPVVEAVSSPDLNVADRHDGDVAEAAAAAPPPQVIARTADDVPADTSWAKQMAMVLGGAFAAAAAAGRMLMA